MRKEDRYEEEEQEQELKGELDMHADCLLSYLSSLHHSHAQQAS
jgi:hypothetical protein